MQSIFVIRYTKSRLGILKLFAFLLPLFFMLLCLQVKAQSPVNYVEYYVDQDPGLGNATPVTVTAATSIVNASFTVNVASLSQGVHILSARARTVSGIWGMSHYWFMVKPYSAFSPITLAKISRVEYFIDADPGLGKANSVSITAGNSDIANSTFNFDPSVLSKGTHIVGVRSQDANGVWSLTNFWLFYNPFSNIPTPAAPVNINYVEYFLDTDPGIGNATPVTVTPGTDISNGTINANITSLGTGAHILGTRGKDASGSWSFTNFWLFAKPFANTNTVTVPNITAVEYFLDYDPGVGNGKSVSITAGTDLSNLTINADISSIIPGSHFIIVRAKDASGNWSLINSLPFTIPGTAPIMSTLVSATTLCAGGTVNAGYTVSGVTFNSDNKFIAQLSDASGNFINPIQIGSTNSTNSTNSVGQFTCTIPSNVATGFGYRIRIISTSQVITGADNGTNISVTSVGLPVITIPTKDTTVCQGNAFQLTGSNINGSVQWLLNGSAISAATGSTYNVASASTANNGVYNLRVTNGACSATSTNTTVTINTNVPAIPTLSPTGNVQITLGNSITLTSSATSGNQWLLNNVVITGAISQTLSVNTAGTYKVQVSNGTCSSVSVNSAVVSLILGNGAPLITSSRPTTFCLGDSTVLTSSITTGGNQWNLNGTAIAGATGNSYTVKTAGSYTVTNAALTSTATVITVNALPTAVITASGATSICSGNSVLLNASAGSSYKWFINNNQISGAATASYTASLAGDYSVQVTNANGCSASSIPVSVVVNTAPSIPTISITGSVNFCSGDSTLLTSSATSNNQWYLNGVAISGAVNKNFSAKQSGIYTVVNSNGNCNATSTGVTITVNAAPVTPVITASGASVFCSGNNIVLTSNTATGNQWYKDTALIAGATGISYTATQTGNYSVRINNGSGCTGSSLAFPVTVNALPNKPVISNSGDTVFCSGASVILNSNAGNGNQWFKDTTAITGANSTFITVNQAGTYTVRVSNTNGCVNTSSPINIKVNALPAIPAVTAGGPTTFCGNGSVVFTSSSATNNQWYKDGVIVIGASGATFTATVSGNYTDTVTNTSGCKAGSVATTVSFNSTPTAPVITVNGNASICTGSSVVLSSSYTNGNQWYKDGVIVSGATSASFTATASGVYTDTVTFTGGCKSGSAGTTISVSAAPSVPVISAGGSVSFCFGGSVVLSSSSATGNQWFKDSVLISGATSSTYTASQSGKYSLVVTNAGGCSAGSAGATTITVNALPNIPVISAGGPTSFCNGLNVVLSSNATTGNQWYKDTSVISGATNATYTATATGNYAVKVTNAAGCSAVSSGIVVTVAASLTKPTITRNNTDLVSSSSTGNQWYQDATAIGGATAATYRPTVSGYYKTQISAGGCTSPFSDPYYYLVSAVSNITASAPGSYTLLPNPVTDKLIIQSANTTDKITAQLIDGNGRVILSRDFKGKTEIVMQSFTGGVYTVLLTNTTTKKQESKQVIKL